MKKHESLIYSAVGLAALFLLLVVFAGGEWVYRRARGLA